MGVPALRVVRRPKGASAASDNLPALTAASQPVLDTTKSFSTQLGGIDRRKWQAEAWEHFRECGELEYWVSWRANSVSRVRLIASELDPDTGRPTGGIDEDDPECVRAAEIVNQIAGGAGGQSQLQKRSAECLSIPGEHWVALLNLGDVVKGPGGVAVPKLAWFVLTKREIKTMPDGGAQIELPDGTQHDYNPPNGDSMFRVWFHDPERAKEPHSPVRSSLPSLREIRRCTAKIASAGKSRLIGNGVLFLPQGMSLPSASTPVASNQPGAPLPEITGRPAADQLSRLLVNAAKAAIQDPDSVAAHIPIMATVPDEQLEKIQHLEFGKDVLAVEIQTRNDAIVRLATGLDVSPERLLGIGSSTNHWCVDEKTEALSQRGWLTHDELRVGDMVLTLNHETGLSEWKPVMDVYQASVVDEPMRKMTTQRHSSLTTMAHRWPVMRLRGTPGSTEQWVREWTTTEDFDVPHKMITAAPAADVPTTAKYSDDLVELLAWYWTEGSQNAAGQISIAQSHTVNPTRVERIRSVLTRLDASWSEWIQENRGSHGGPVTVFGLHKASGETIKALVPGRDKIVPTTWIRELTAAQLRLFVEVSCLGDGWHLRRGVMDIWQKNAHALDAFELALILSGVAVSRHGSGGGVAVRALKGITQRPGKAAKGRRSVVVENYTGTVWCPTTENRTWFARRDGQVFYTGNSAWQIGDEDIQLHVAPIMETLCAAITTEVLRATFIAEGIDPDRFVLWYDTSQLTADPDKTEEATEAHDRGAITTDAYRRYLGLGDEDGYDLTSLEGWQEWAADAVAKDPTLITELLPLLPVEISSLDFPTPQPALPPGQEDPDQEEHDDAERSKTSEPDTENDSQDGNAALRRDSTPTELVLVHRLLVNRALELAGKRRVKVNDRQRRMQLRGVAAHDYHRYMPPVTDPEIPKLIEGWDVGLSDEVVTMLGVQAGPLRDAVVRQVYRELTRPVIDAEVI